MVTIGRRAEQGRQPGIGYIMQTVNLRRQFRHRGMVMRDIIDENRRPWHPAQQLGNRRTFGTAIGDQREIHAMTGQRPFPRLAGQDRHIAEHDHLHVMFKPLQGGCGAIDGFQILGRIGKEALEQQVEFLRLYRAVIQAAADIPVEGVGSPVEVELPGLQKPLQPAHEVEQDLVGIDDQQRPGGEEGECFDLGGNRCGKGIRVFDFQHDPARDCHPQTAWPGWLGMLQITGEAGKRRAHQAIKNIRGRQHMSKTVLIVEDNELNMKLFHDLLDAHGYQTLQTKDGMEALAMVRQHRPDLILMDIQLPEVSGLEVIKWIKEDDNLRSIPVVAVTAFAMKGDEEKMREGGCDAYIAKPISVGKFIETVKQFLDPKA